MSTFWQPHGAYLVLRDSSAWLFLSCPTAFGIGIVLVWAPMERLGEQLEVLEEELEEKYNLPQGGVRAPRADMPAGQRPEM